MADAEIAGMLYWLRLGGRTEVGIFIICDHADNMAVIDKVFFAGSLLSARTSGVDCV